MAVFFFLCRKRDRRSCALPPIIMEIKNGPPLKTAIFHFYEHGFAFLPLASCLSWDVCFSSWPINSLPSWHTRWAQKPVISRVSCIWMCLLSKHCDSPASCVSLLDGKYANAILSSSAVFHFSFLRLTLFGPLRAMKENMKKASRLCIGYFCGDEILPSLCGNYFINHDIFGSLWIQ